MLSNLCSKVFNHLLSRKTTKELNKGIDHASIAHLLRQKDTSNKMKDTVFVRHAHSEFNRACEDYRIEHNISYDWQALRQHPGFSDCVAYNPQYIDCPLTQVGIQQCYLTSQNLELDKIDIILVSPHQRALQTCDNILRFAKKHNHQTPLKKIPIIVQPLIAGSLWSSCDISKRLQKKIDVFKQFDYTRIMKLPELWFIENLRDKDKRRIYSQIKQRKLRTYEDKQLLILQMIRTQQVQQDREILRIRSSQIKRELLRLKEKHCNILLISHYYIIQYINSRAFNQINHMPIDQLDLKNCYPYYNNLQDILSYK